MYSLAFVMYELAFVMYALAFVMYALAFVVQNALMRSFLASMRSHARRRSQLQMPLQCLAAVQLSYAVAF